MNVNTTCRPRSLSHELLRRLVGIGGAVPLAADIDASLGVHEKSHDETVETQDFGENENENHADEEPRLLGGSSHACVTNDTDSKTSSHTSKTHRKTRTQLDKTRVERKLLSQTVRD